MPKSTFILRNITQEAIDGILAMSPADAYTKLAKWAFGDLRHCVTQKCGTGQFSDRVEWNRAMRDVAAGKTLAMKLEPRKGYRLITFEV